MLLLLFCFSVSPTTSRRTDEVERQSHSVKVSVKESLTRSSSTHKQESNGAQRQQLDFTQRQLMSINLIPLRHNTNNCKTRLTTRVGIAPHFPHLLLLTSIISFIPLIGTSRAAQVDVPEGVPTFVNYTSGSMTTELPQGVIAANSLQLENFK